MLKKFSALLASLSLLLVMAWSPAIAFAATTPTTLTTSQSSKEDACQALANLDSTTGCTAQAQDGVDKVVRAVVNILSVVVGIVSVIMIILSGFKYVTSGGDSGRVSSAKSTLVYALVGLAVVASAQTIIHFVLTNVKP